MTSAAFGMVLIFIAGLFSNAGHAISACAFVVFTLAILPPSGKFFRRGSSNKNAGLFSGDTLKNQRRKVSFPIFKPSLFEIVRIGQRRAKVLPRKPLELDSDKLMDSRIPYIGSAGFQS